MSLASLGIIPQQAFVGAPIGTASIQYVGGKSLTWSSDTIDPIPSLDGLSGGIDTEARVGDFWMLCALEVAGTAGVPGYVSPVGYISTLLQNRRLNDTEDNATFIAHGYIEAGTTDFGQIIVGGGTRQRIYQVIVFRGVDPVYPFLDVVRESGTTNEPRPHPARQGTMASRAFSFALAPARTTLAQSSISWAPNSLRC